MTNGWLEEADNTENVEQSLIIMMHYVQKSQRKYAEKEEEKKEKQNIKSWKTPPTRWRLSAAIKNITKRTVLIIWLYLVIALSLTGSHQLQDMYWKHSYHNLLEKSLLMIEAKSLSLINQVSGNQIEFRKGKQILPLDYS